MNPIRAVLMEYDPEQNRDHIGGMMVVTFLIFALGGFIVGCLVGKFLL